MDVIKCVLQSAMRQPVYVTLDSSSTQMGRNVTVLTVSEHFFLLEYTVSGKQTLCMLSFVYMSYARERVRTAHNF